MKILIDPGPDRWPHALRRSAREDRSFLVALAQANVGVVGSAPLTQTRPLIATGHQAGFWHPGILVKDIAAARAAQRLSAGLLHVVVDQDINDALTIHVPTLCDEERLEAEPLQLAAMRSSVPTGSQPPVDAQAVVDTLQQARRRLGCTLAADLEPLMQAWREAPRDAPTLAAQVTSVLLKLMRPWTGPMPVIFASQLRQAPPFVALVQRMLAEPRACVSAYNAAVRQHAQAGVAPLRVEPDRIELPLWLTEFEQPRQRVFADIADRDPLLVTESGRTLDAQRDALAPRALLLTAFLRRSACDLFVHGKGGGLYDQATEAWWQSWLHEDLAMRAVVSADLTLPLQAPQADERELRRAAWWAHHLPHNLDRALRLDGQLVRRKRELLAHMDDDRDPRRRAAAFTALHDINDELAAEHGSLLREARRNLRRARAGVVNRALLAKRDWSFALYPRKMLAELHAAVDDRFILAGAL